MFLLRFSLVVLTLLNVTHGLAVHEKIEPVDLKYHCIQTEDEEHGKSPVLLIHGLSASQKNWDGVNEVLALRTKRKVCAVDLRNHGDSPWNNRTDIAALAVDIGHFLDQQNIKKVNIIGHSLGGKTAVHYTLNNPDRVDSVVIEDMRPNGLTEASILFVQSYMQILKKALKSVPEGANEEEARRSVFDYVNGVLKKVKAPEILEEKDINIIELRSINEKWQFKWNFDILSEAAKEPERILTESTGSYTGPTLFIYGTKSPFAVADDKDNIIKLFPNAKLEPVEGASHIIHGRFHQFDETVIRFLNGLN